MSSTRFHLLLVIALLLVVHSLNACTAPAPHEPWKGFAFLSPTASAASGDPA